MKIRSKLLLSALFYFALAAGAAVSLEKGVRDINEAQRAGDWASVIVKDVGELGLLSYEYLLRPRGRIVTQWSTKHAAVGRLLAERFPFAASAGALERMRNAHDALPKLFAEVQARGAALGASTEEIERARDLRAKLVSQMLIEIQRLVSAGFQLERVSGERLQEAQTRSNQITIGFLLALALGLAVSTFTVLRSVLRPISKLQRGVDTVGDGDLTHRVGTKARDEFGVLSRSFDAMTERLEKKTADLVEYQDDLTKKVHERTAALEAKTVELEASSRVDRVTSRVLLAFSRKKDISPPEQVLDILVDEAQYRPMAFYSWDEQKGQLVLTASRDLPKGSSLAVASFGEGLVGEAAEQRKTIMVDAPSEGAFTLDTGVGQLKPGTVFALPLLQEEELLGVLVGASPVRLGERERGWLDQVAGQVAVGLLGRRQFHRLEVLTEELNERTQQIEQQNVELERANHLKSEFVANVSHELRTPLNAIIGFSESLQGGCVGELTEAQLEYSEEILAAGRHLLSMINDILDLSKIEAGKMTLQLGRVLVTSLCDTAITIIKHQADQGGVRLDLQLDEDISGFRADEGKLKQILFNLLSNAVKFTPAGGRVTLAVKLDSSKDEATQICFLVSDTGIGISEEDQARLFTPFQQLDSSTSRNFEGAGLGLALSKELAELHGGEIRVESQPGKGSLFELRIPYRPALQPVLTSAPIKPAPKRRSPGVSSILLIEEDDQAAKALMSHLMRAGYEVSLAGDAGEGLALAECARPTFIVLDVVANGGGWASLARLKEDARTADVPVLVVSAARDRSREEALALGAADVVKGPISAVDLVDALRRHGLKPPLSS